MATRTLNQIRREIQQFAWAHGQILTAKFCEVADFHDEGDEKYPAMLYNYTGATKDANVLRMSFQFAIGSRSLAEGTNTAEVWSDSTSIACDLLAFLSDDNRDYTLENGSRITPFKDDTGDLFSGVMVEVVLKLTYPYDRCIIPAKAARYLITEDGLYMGTEAGQPFIQEPLAGVAEETGEILTTENDKALI